MLCPRCATTNGKAHSFEKIGTLKDNKTNLFYTCPGMAEEQDDSPEAVSYYLAHFETTRPNPWIWMFDCRGIKSKDLIRSGMAKKLAEVVQKTYFDTLLGVYIVNPSMTIKTLLAFLSPFLRKETKAKIHLCSLGLIDTINKLEIAGVQRNDLHTITKKLT
jgi:hypothetical protein